MILTFNNKKEFAEAILKHGKLFKGDMIVECSQSSSVTSPFIIIKNGIVSSMGRSWDTFNQEWSTTPPLKDKDLVWCWDDPCCAKIVTFFDSISNCSFHPSGKRCGNVWGNYELFTGEWPEWAKEAVKTLED